MSALNFACPNCGHKIPSDTTQVGAHLICPSCNTPLTVPNLTPPPAPPPGVAGSQKAPPHTASATPPTVEKTSGLAIASLVCSLSTFVICIGWIPGIICGHLAKSELRRNPNLKGSGMATAGLVIGYILMAINILGLICWMLFFAAAFKKGYERGRQHRTQPYIQVNPSSKPEAAEEDNSAQADPLYTLDLTNAEFPAHPASGKIGGSNFSFETAKLEHGALSIVQGKENLIIFLFPNQNESLDGKSYNIAPDSTPAQRTPHIHMHWTSNTGQVKSAIFTKNYAMKLEFGIASDAKIPGKIYLCLPDKQKSYLAGTFQADVKSNGTTTPAANAQ